VIRHLFLIFLKCEKFLDFAKELRVDAALLVSKWTGTI